MRKISLLCVIAILLSSFVCTTYAASVNDDFNADESITAEEQLFLQEKLVEYGYGNENFSAEVLYNSNEDPGYLLGITADGYIIFERDSHRFWECGEGNNPYNRYMECKKFYGGLMCYFVKLPEEQGSEETAGEYFDILREKYWSFVPTLDRAPDESPEE